MATVSTPMTTAEFLGLPDDGTRRWLVDGGLTKRIYQRRSHARPQSLS
jgi:hypothetical protein